jgi:hypothetical protein
MLACSHAAMQPCISAKWSRTCPAPASHTTQASSLALALALALALEQGENKGRKRQSSSRYLGVTWDKRTLHHLPHIFCSKFSYLLPPHGWRSTEPAMLRAGPTCLSIAGRAGWRLAGTGLRSASSLFSARAAAAGQHERVSQTPYPYPPTAHDARRSPDGVGWGFAAAALVVAGAGVRTSSADHDDVPLREVALVSEQWRPGLEGLIVSGELKRLRQARHACVLSALTAATCRSHPKRASRALQVPHWKLRLRGGRSQGVRLCSCAGARTRC